MTPEEKQLLIKDLCARLPYGVEIICEASPRSLTLSAHMLDEIIKDSNKLQWKPYLRPLSSITEEEKEEASEAIEIELKALQGPGGFTVENAASYTFMIDFYNKHLLDYRGLIEKGLALEAPKDMYKVE